MRKVLVAAIAFSLVLISGAFLNARAQSACGCDLSWLSPCNWHLATCCPAEAPAAAEVPAPAPPPQEQPAEQSGCCFNLSWLNPCNWNLSTCCPAEASAAAEAPAAAEVPAPAPPPPPQPAAETGCCLNFSWLNPCNWFSGCSSP